MKPARMTKWTLALHVTAVSLFAAAWAWGADNPTKTVPQGGILRGALEADIDHWDGTSYYSEGYIVSYLTCRGLMGFPATTKSPSNLVPRPDLAAAPPRVSSDGLTYTFTLRQGIRFSNGAPVTTADVEDSFLRTLDAKAAFTGGGTGLYDVIEGAEAFRNGKATDVPGITTTRDTITFKLTRRDGSFNYVLAMPFSCVFPKGSPRNHTEVPPPTTAPYMLVQHEPNRLVKIVRNPMWERNRAAGLPEDPNTNNVDEVELQIAVPADTQLLRIKNNELDFSLDYSAVRGANLSAVAGDASLKDRFYASPRARLKAIIMNTSVPPFDNVKARQAVSYAIDRVGLIKVLGGPSVGVPWSQIFAKPLIAPGEPAEIYPATSDIARAKALLAGSQLPLTATVHYREKTDEADLAPAIQSQLAQIGIQLKLQGHTQDVYVAYISNPKNEAQMFFSNWETDIPDGAGIFSQAFPSSAAGGGANWSQLRDPAVDADIARITAMPIGTARTAAWSQLSTHLTRNVAPWAVITSRNALQLTSTRYGGYYFSVVKYLDLAQAYIKKQ
jgi:peptide/nickel transport system substrate-binding protein